MKKILAMALALLMVCVMLPVVALAEETTVSDENGLKNAVGSDGTIVLNADITLTASLSIESGRTITINLNGNKISMSADGPHMICNAGTLTIVDTVGSGSIAKEGNASDYGYVIENHGAMILEGIKITSVSSQSSAIENGWYTPSQNTSGANCTMAISNTEISQMNGAGGLYTIKNDDYGVMVINGGEFINSTSGAGAVLNWNDLTINGGKFTGTAAVRTLKDGSAAVGYETGKTVINNGAFNGAIENKLGKYESTDITITNGTFSTNVKDYTYGELVVTDGTNYYVGATATATVESATSGTFTVVSGNGNLTIKGGVTIKNDTNEPITVNGKEVSAKGSYTAPTVIVISGDTTPETPKTDDQKNPATGANDVVAVAAALMAVSALGAVVLTRKK